MAPFFSVFHDEPVWLLLDEHLSQRDRKALRQRLLPHEFERHLDLPVWVVTDAWAEAITTLESVGREPCRQCRSGKPCQAWQRVGTFQAGYRPRSPRQTNRPPEAAKQEVPPPPDAASWEQFVREGIDRLFGRRGEPEKYAKVLGLKLPSTREQVLQAFKRAALARHPDRPGGSHEAMKEAIEARDVLLAGLES